MIGKQGHSVLVKLVERKTRFSVAVKAANKTAQAGMDAICDNLKAEGFFAHPYHSRKRGLNENTNSLIQQYIPKGKDIKDLNDQQVAQIMNKIDNRPRKYLGFKTPNQLFFGLNHPVAMAS